MKELFFLSGVAYFLILYLSPVHKKMTEGLIFGFAERYIARLKVYIADFYMMFIKKSVFYDLLCKITLDIGQVLV